MKKSKKTKRLSNANPVKHAKTLIRITPKFIHGIILGGLVGVILVVGLRSGSSASADTTGATCLVNAVTLSNGQGIFKSFTVNGNVATTSFTVSGVAGCSVHVSLGSWQAPLGSSNFLPLTQQKLLYSKSDVFTPGQYTMSVRINDKCYYQVDVVRGSSPTAPDGTANYVGGSLVDFIQAGNTVCEPPAPAPVVTPPATPAVTTTTPTAPPATPTTLVNTGPGAVIVIGVLAIIGGYVFHMTHRHLKHKRHATHSH